IFPCIPKPSHSIFKDMITERTAYIQTIQQRLRDNPIVSLVGPRQAGKSTLARITESRQRKPGRPSLVY
ncbi:MAG: hypothetical protein ACK5DM_24225, partial [Planctomyces sp.]